MSETKIGGLGAAATSRGARARRVLRNLGGRFTALFRNKWVSLVIVTLVTLVLILYWWHFTPSPAPVALPPVAPTCEVFTRPAAGVVVPEWADAVRGNRPALAVRMDEDGLDWFAWGLKPADASQRGDMLTVKGACARGGQQVEGTISLAGLVPGEVRVVPLL